MLVSYPGLASHPQHEAAERYHTHGYGAIVGFGIKGGLEAGKRLIQHKEKLADAAKLSFHLHSCK